MIPGIQASWLSDESSHGRSLTSLTPFLLLKVEKYGCLQNHRGSLFGGEAECTQALAIPLLTFSVNLVARSHQRENMKFPALFLVSSAALCCVNAYMPSKCDY